jgi:hypothetical protein
MRERAPLLERLLARADAPVPIADWRAEAFRLIAPEAQLMPAVAPAALRACASPVPGTWVAVATPVHYVAGMSSVSLHERGILRLEDAEADALAADFNRTFVGTGVSMGRGANGLLLCVFDGPLHVETSDPEMVLGRDVWSSMPRGPDAARLRRLMSEVEMWLFEHAVNEHRRVRSAPAINGLWLWGEGATQEPSPTIRGWTAGEDPLFAAFAPQLDYASAAQPGVVVISDPPGTPEWREAERRWLAPALEDLKEGRARRIELSAGDRRYSVRAIGLRRFWRRPRPWWESLGPRENVDGND